jgi:very-short-patch-repair endonuclease
MTSRHYRKLDTVSFIEDAKKIHITPEYDYSLTVFVKMTNKVTIICPTHGKFQQQPNKHIAGQGCKECGKNRGADLRTKSTEQFIIEAKLIHGSRYCYDKTNYTKNNEQVIIICKEHGEFTQIAGYHLDGNGCADCAGNKQKNTEQFIKEATTIHRTKWSYDKSEYKGALVPVIIICQTHGEFTQTPHHHLSRAQGCGRCALSFPLTQEEWVRRSHITHNNYYDYNETIYKDSQSKVTIKCPEHGNFTQSANSHVRGCGCPSCFNKTEGIVFGFIRLLFTSSLLDFRASWSKNPKNNYIWPFDMVIEELKLIIEVDGPQHFEQTWCWGTPEDTRRKDVWKMKQAIKNGYSVIRIPQVPVLKNGIDFLKAHLSSLLKMYNEPTVMYISGLPAYKQVYDDHKQLMESALDDLLLNNFEESDDVTSI